MDGVVVSTFAFHAGVGGSIPCINQHIFNFPFSQSHPSGITKPSSIKLATSGITSPPNAERGESYKRASIKAYLLLQGLK